ncbi:MAG: phosphoglycerate kinase [Acidobacteriia bacterium]|nr:phosphoglycerate kinase [Terriglobia bacterium]
MKKLSIRDLDLEGKRIFVRVDFNVPLNEDGKIQNDARIKLSLPTIQYALSRGAKVILASHLGRPGGKINPNMSLRPVAVAIKSALGCPVKMADSCIGSEVVSQSQLIKSGEILLLENLRFHPGEEANEIKFAQQLATLCDLYVNDAFGTVHRAHASTTGIIPFVGQSAVGFLMEKELLNLGCAITNPKRPYVAIIGGAKISGKIEIVEKLIKLVDVILIGGGMAYTFLKAKGVEVGRSLVESDKIILAQDLLKKSKKQGSLIVLPVDHLVVENLRPGASIRSTLVDKTPEESIGVDIGPATCKIFEEKISTAKTIFWNGPLGIFEMADFSQGTLNIAKAVSESQAMTIVGGGDSISALSKAGVTEKINHVSTGGGASLEFLSGKNLPGLEALSSQ